jgi:GrpB-like predicted nucleotidyltransferase (UPF0157 family)
MPKKKPLPAHLEVFLATLEGQEGAAPDRLAALDAAEKVADKPIILEDALRSHPEFKARYRRWLERQKIAMQDAQVGRVKAGKASAAPVIASFDEFQPAEDRGNNGRPVLGRRQGSPNASDRW